jgi:ATP:ADP antiporter, AAA family
VALIVVIERRALSARVTHDEVHPDEPFAEQSAWRLLARDRYLWFIAGMAVFLNWVNSSGEYLLDRTLLVAATEAAAHGTAARVFIGTFKAEYFAWYNAIGVALQLFAVARILKIAGVRRALYCLPGFALVAYGAAFFFPVLAVMRIVKIGENSLQYSLQDTSRHALFLVTSRVEKFVGKTAVDTIAVRVGAIMSGVVVFVGSRLGWSLRTFAALNVGLAAVWIAFVILIGREHRHRSAERARATAVEPNVREDADAVGSTA